MKILTLFLTLFIFSGLASGQDLLNRLIATGGNYSESNSYKLSYTIGDVMVNKLETQSVSFTTGFQQNWNLSVGIDDLSGELSLIAYPNPVTEKLLVRFGEVEYSDIHIEILSFNGKIVFSQKIEGPFYGRTEELDISELNSGLLILRVSSQKDMISKTIKLIKR